MLIKEKTEISKKLKKSYIVVERRIDGRREEEEQQIEPVNADCIRHDVEALEGWVLKYSGKFWSAKWREDETYS